MSKCQAKSEFQSNWVECESYDHFCQLGEINISTDELRGYNFMFEQMDKTESSLLTKSGRTVLVRCRLSK